MLKQKDIKPSVLDNVVQDALQQAVGTDSLKIDAAAVSLPLSALLYALKTVCKLSPGRAIAFWPRTPHRPLACVACGPF